MKKFEFSPFDADSLISKFKEKNPTYKVQKLPIGNRYKVMLDGVSSTGILQLHLKPKEGKIKTVLPSDRALLFLLILLPLGIYLMFTKKKQQAFEKQVMDDISAILNA